MRLFTTLQVHPLDILSLVLVWEGIPKETFDRYGNAFKVRI